MEMIPKQTPKIPFWVDILFYLSVVLLIFTLISYFSLNHFLETSQKTLADLETTLSEEISEKAVLKNEILTYQKKIKDFSRLINAHLKTSNIFDFMEEQCHPEVWFNEFSLDTEAGKVLLAGEAQNFEALGQQMLILRDEKLIKSIDLGGVSLKKEGKINFNLSLSFDPSIFIFK
jgi:Tfp pilus assembly protein PilN